MIYITRIYHRKDNSIEWYKSSTTYDAHLKKNYLDTKKVLNVVSEESNDKLSLINLAIFANKEAKEEFQNDPICIAHMTSRIDYYDSNSILSELPVIIEK